MTAVRRTIAMLTAVTLLALGTPAYAARDTTVEEIHNVSTVDFTLNPGPDGCSQLESAVSASAQLANDITVTTYANGSRKVVDVGEAKGTATDSEGRTYRYHYANRAVYIMPADGSIVFVQMRDSFELKGQGRTNRVNARFLWHWTFVPSDPAAIPTTATIPWPPQDNLVELVTLGDPLHCDPL